MAPFEFDGSLIQDHDDGQGLSYSDIVPLMAGTAGKRNSATNMTEAGSMREHQNSPLLPAMRFEGTEKQRPATSPEIPQGILTQLSEINRLTTVAPPSRAVPLPEIPGPANPNIPGVQPADQTPPPPVDRSQQPTVPKPSISDKPRDPLLASLPFLPTREERARMQASMRDCSIIDVPVPGTERILCKKGHSLTIANLIEQLRSDRYADREKASTLLKELPQAIQQVFDKLRELPKSPVQDDLEQKRRLEDVLAHHNKKGLEKLETQVFCDDKATRERAYKELESKKTGHITTTLVPALREELEVLEARKSAIEGSSFVRRLIPNSLSPDETADRRTKLSRALDEMILRDGIELDRLGRIRQAFGTNGFVMSIKYDGMQIKEMCSRWVDEVDLLNPERNNRADIPLPMRQMILSNQLVITVDGNLCSVNRNQNGSREEGTQLLDFGFTSRPVYLDTNGDLVIQTQAGQVKFRTGLAEANRSALKHIY